METSLMVNDYPEPPEEPTKEVSGTITITYTFEDLEVPEELYDGDLEQFIKDNLDDIDLNKEDVEVEID